MAIMVLMMPRRPSPCFPPRIDERNRIEAMTPWYQQVFPTWQKDPWTWNRSKLAQRWLALIDYNCLLYRDIYIYIYTPWMVAKSCTTLDGWNMLKPYNPMGSASVFNWWFGVRWPTAPQGEWSPRLQVPIHWYPISRLVMVVERPTFHCWKKLGKSQVKSRDWSGFIITILWLVTIMSNPKRKNPIVSCNTYPHVHPHLS